MTEATEHTPLPWEVWRINTGDKEGLPAIVASNGGPCLAELTRWTGVGTSDPEMIEANAALIVRAVTAHADLVAALKAVEWSSGDSEEPRCPISTCHGIKPGTWPRQHLGHIKDCQLAAALAKAKETK